MKFPLIKEFNIESAEIYRDKESRHFIKTIRVGYLNGKINYITILWNRGLNSNSIQLQGFIERCNSYSIKYPLHLAALLGSPL